VLWPPDSLRRVLVHDLADHEPVVEHADGRKVLLHGRGRVALAQLLDVGRRDRGQAFDAVLGQLDSGHDRFVVAIEGKGPQDPLDRPFAGRRMSAVDRGYRYAINAPCDAIHSAFADVMPSKGSVRFSGCGSQTRRTDSAFHVRPADA
jgi:hypothetical protein